MRSVSQCLSIVSAGPLLALAIVSSAMAASDVEPSKDAAPLEEMAGDGRYQLKRSGDDFVRLDRKTGQMSICRIRSGNLICQMAADDREALQEEMGDLQERLSRLESTPDASKDKGINKREDTARNRDQNNDDDDFPLDEEIEEAMDYSAKVLKRFFTVMKDLREDFNDLSR